MKTTPIKILQNKVHPKVRLNAICPYFTMFPLWFPFKILRAAKESDIVYDPFCGRGTTNYAARLFGIASYGVDSNPVAHAIAQAKLVSVKPEAIQALCATILQNQPATRIPEGEFWEWAYHSNTLSQICCIREYFQAKVMLDKVDIAFRAVMLGILHGPRMKTQASYLSNQMPRTFSTKPDYSVKFWKKHSLRPFLLDVATLVKRKAHYVFTEQVPKKTSGQIVLGDSRSISQVSNKKFDWIITSPPYYGMATYEQDQWLRNWFLGGLEKVVYVSNGQIKHWSEAGFIKDLSKVWANTAKKSKPGAKMIIRFGALPSKAEKSPSELIKESLLMADCGWKIKTIHSAGKPIEAKRQANQFKNATAGYIEEIDVYTMLNV
jgi:DNA methylase